MRMPLSLLDLLSCSLAAVIIILIISLSTGTGNRDAMTQATLIELKFLGDDAPVPLEAYLQWKGGTDSLTLRKFSPDGKEEIMEFDFSPAQDSLLGIGSFIYPGIRRLGFYEHNEKLSYGRKIDLTIPTQQELLKLTLVLESNYDFDIVYKLTSKNNESKTGGYEIEDGGRILLHIICYERVTLICTGDEENRIMEKRLMY